MIQTRFNTIFLFIALLAITNVAYSASDSGLFDMQGKPASLNSEIAKGKWTVVMFWASDCHVCAKEAPNYVMFHEKNKRDKAIVLGISLDGNEYKQDAKSFIRNHKLTFRNLIGSRETIAGLYNELTGDIWRGTPTFLIFNPQGKLRAAQEGGVPVKLIEEFIDKNSK